MTTKGKLPKIILFIARGLEFVTFVRSPEILSHPIGQWLFYVEKLRPWKEGK